MRLFAVIAATVSMPMQHAGVWLSGIKHCMGLAHKVFLALALTQAYPFGFHNTNLSDAADRAGGNTSRSSHLAANATPRIPVDADAAC